MAIPSAVVLADGCFLSTGTRTIKCCSFISLLCTCKRGARVHAYIHAASLRVRSCSFIRFCLFPLTSRASRSVSLLHLAPAQYPPHLLQPGWRESGTGGDTLASADYNFVSFPLFNHTPSRSLPSSLNNLRDPGSPPPRPEGFLNLARTDSCKLFNIKF